MEVLVGRVENAFDNDSKGKNSWQKVYQKQMPAHS